MAHDNSEILIRTLLSTAGITVDGDKPFDIQVHNKGFYGRLLRDGALGAGESYVDGWWDCRALDQFFDMVMRANVHEKVKGNLKAAWPVVKSKLFNLQKRSRAYQVGEQHYDLGTDLYRAMLDRRMNYTCGYWRNATTLDDAQEAKLELVKVKLNLVI